MNSKACTKKKKKMFFGDFRVIYNNMSNFVRFVKGLREKEKRRVKENGTDVMDSN